MGDIKYEELKRFSPITYYLERLFWIIQYTSIANLIFKTRVKTQNEFNDELNMREITIKRGRRIEAYMLITLLILIVCSFAVSFFPAYGKFLIILPFYRIYEIITYAINMNIFDRLRLGNKKHYVSGVTRTIVLSMWNFLELLFCFAIIYSSMLDKIKYAVSISDAYYFSFITQLTIGYGDLAPLGVLRFIAPVQGILGFLFGLFVLSRLVTLLPRVESVQLDV